MKQIVPEIYVLDCKNALSFYEQVFGGTVKNLKMSEDNELFSEYSDKVVHAELHVNNRCIFYFADIFNRKRSRAGNVTLMLHMDSKEEIERTYNALCVGGHIGMELQETLTGALHAIVTDRFGAPWSMNYAYR